MIIKNVSGLDVLRWISKKWQGNKTIATASNKLNCYKLHTCNENYDLKNNDGEDMRGNLFQWVDLKKWQYLAAFENDTMGFQNGLIGSINLILRYGYGLLSEWNFQQMHPW